MEKETEDKFLDFLIRKGLIDEDAEGLDNLINSFNRHFVITSKAKTDKGKGKAKFAASKNPDEKPSRRKVDMSEFEEPDAEEEVSSPKRRVKDSYEVVLRDRQVDHFNRMIDILGRGHFALDLSSMGLGKTHIISKICQVLGFKNMMSICPKSVIPTWIKASKDYKLPIAQLTPDIDGIMTYESLRGTKVGVTKNELLEMHVETKGGIYDEDTGKTSRVSKTTTFTATKKLDKLIKKGCLFAFDEFQKSKNAATNNHLACKAIILRVKYFADQGYTKSKIILSTGTIIDTEIQAVTFMSLVGIQEHEDLYTNYRGVFITEGLGYEEILDFANSLDRDATRLAISEGLNPPPEVKNEGTAVRSATKVRMGRIEILGKNNIKSVVFSIFHNVIEQYLSSAMPPPDYEVPLDVKNGYFFLSNKRSKKLHDAVLELSEAVRFDKQSGTIFGKGSQNSNFGSVTLALRAIEIAKLEIFIRIAITELEARSNSKIPIILNYLSNVRVAAKILDRYNPLILYGQVSQANRDMIIQKFNRNDNKYRVYIGQFRASSSGIELDDKDGNYPRFPLISPNFSAIDTHQVTYRFYRDGTKSSPKIRYLYSQGVGLETNILNAYQRKSDVFRKTLKTQTENGMMFPGDYKKVKEGEVRFPHFEYEGFTIVIKDEEVVNDSYKTLSNLIDELMREEKIDVDDEED